jgi:hypothetical protein
MISISRTTARPPGDPTAEDPTPSPADAVKGADIVQNSETSPLIDSSSEPDDDGSSTMVGSSELESESGSEAMEAIFRCNMVSRASRIANASLPVGE